MVFSATGFRCSFLLLLGVAYLLCEAIRIVLSCAGPTRHGGFAFTGKHTLQVVQGYDSIMTRQQRATLAYLATSAVANLQA